MLFYNNPIYYNHLVLTIDNVILDTSISNPERRDLLENIISNIANGERISVVSWQGHKPGTFRNQTVFRVDDERSFWLGNGLLGNGTLIDRYRLDFNPNKIGEDPNFKIIREFLVRNSRDGLCKIPRFDLAIDIPVDRSKCFLVKDRRLYIERRHGAEFTQYLGAKSSSVGRVKLYNKAAEANLDYPLTRLELTLDPSMAYENINFPTVYCIDPEKLVSNEIRVTDTERFILNAILQDCGSITDLCRKTRAKIELLLNNYVNPIVVPKESYDLIIKQLNNKYLQQHTQI